VQPPADAATFLFSESAARAVVAVRPGAAEDLALACEQAGVPAAVIGTTGGAALEVTGLFSVPLAELADVHRAALRALFA
jgi:phosphoribosylformylglycinamidine synthase subunit PurL